jgi:hypothetical protein
MSLTPREAFKVGFLSRCVEDGLTLEQAHQRVKEAQEKIALSIPGADIPGKLIDAAGSIAKPALGWGIPLALAAPPVVGGLAGYAASKATDIDDTDVDEVKRRELINEYKKQTKKLLRDRQIRDYRKDRKQSGRVFL